MKRLQNAVAVLMILGMLGCLGFIIYAGNVINGNLGPSALAVSPDGRLFVASHGKLHVFASESQREAVFDLEQLGTTPIPSDLAVRADGTLLVANSRTATLDVCDLAKASCASGKLGLIGWTPAQLMPGNAFKIAIDEGAGRIYISDNGGQRLMITDATGKMLGSSVASGPVLFPNQLRSYAPGELTVADTNHNRIVTFDITGDRIGRALRTIPISAPRFARPGRMWPFAMARLPDGRFWVLVARNGMKDADVILYGDAVGAIKRMDLGDESDPFAIALWKDTILVADGRNNRLQAFSPEGANLHDIGGPAFAEELKALVEQSEAWRAFRTVATVAMIAFPVLGILLLWRMGVPLVAPNRGPISRPESATPAPIAPGKTIWISVDPRAAKRTRVILVVMLGLIVAMLGTFLSLAYWKLSANPEALAKLTSSPRFPHMVFSFAMVTVMMGVAILLIRAQGRMIESMRIGASSEGFHYVWPALWPPGKASSAGPIPWRDVLFDGRRILAGTRAILLKAPAGPETFPRAAVENEILTRIPKANFISGSELGWKALKRAAPAAKVAYGLLFVIACVMVFWGKS